ncbi:MAG: hypothetical protein ABI665_06480 [Vicinamibacterales bacterium]
MLFRLGVLLLAWQAAGPLTDADLARLEREATARAQAVAVSGGPAALSAEIARELTSVGQYEDFYLVGPFAPAYRNFPAETVAAFRAVDMEIQYSLLLWSWRRLAFPAMAPVLKSLYQSPPDDYAKMRDLALRRLHDIAPDEARPFLLAELQRDELRVSMTTLDRLPDLVFPDFEGAWLRHLADGILDERLDAAVRLERFGSPAVLSDIKRLYAAGASQWSCEVRGAVLGYLARVDASGSAATVRVALNAQAPEGDDCRESYLKSAALRPQLLARVALPATPLTIVAKGPTPGDETRVQFAIGDQGYRSVEELLNRLGQLPSGATLSWVYEAGTAGTHPERWTMAERHAVFARVQQAALARGITVVQP